MERFAVIDMGSNSIRLLKCLVAEGEIVSAEKELIMTRLGQGVNESKQLSEVSMEKTYEALDVFLKVANQYGASLIGAFATSAVRDSRNQSQFVTEAKRRTGVDVTVIDGDREAKLGYLGVLAGLASSFETIMVVDIGGGSTEIIVGDKTGILYAKSFDMGAVRMTEMFLPSDPPGIDELSKLSDYVRVLSQEIQQIVLTYKPQVAVGIGGTITTIGAVALQMETYDRSKIHNYELGLQEIHSIFSEFTSVSLPERVKISGLQPKRADIITAGTAILVEVMNLSGFESIRVSDYDNLEGVLAEAGILKI